MESVLERGMWFVVCLQCDNNDNNNKKNDDNENERFTLKAKLCYPHVGVNIIIVYNKF